MAFSWSRSDGSQNGVSYTTDSGAPPNTEAVGGYVIDVVKATLTAVIGGSLTPAVGFTPVLSVLGGAATIFARANAGAGPATLGFYHTRGADVATHGALVTADTLGRIQFYGDDGATAQPTAQMQAEVNGSVSAGVVPTDIVFKTGVNGAPSEALRLKSDQTAQFSGPVNLGGFARVTSSDFTTTGQSLVDITGLTFATVANGVYAFRAVLSVNGADANGLKVGVQHSGAGATVEGQAHGSLLATSALAARISALNTATPAFATSATDGGVVIEGILTVGANAGNLTIQLLKVTSGTATVRINSFLDVKRIA